ncbi:hypothetical protein EG831_01570 [bacterium]|nr:hypothetical protein [bacterium]
MKKTLFLLATAFGTGFAPSALAIEDAGTIKTVQGSVSVLRAGQKLAAAPGLKVQAADKLTTGADGSVGITLRDNTLLSAGPNSSLSLDKFAFNPTTHEGAIDASLKRGTLAVISGKIAKASPDAVTFRTNSVTLGVRGTEFIIEANGKDD